MEIKVVVTCPLGSKCEEIKGEELHRCAWLVKLAGINPNNGEPTDEKKCSIPWLPILLIENSQQQRSTAAAVESFRNEMVNANEASQRFVALAAGLPKMLGQRMDTIDGGIS